MIMNQLAINPFQVLSSKLDNQLLKIEAIEKVLAKSNSEPESEQPYYITKDQAADIASVSPSTIGNWCRAKHLTRYYFGKSLRIDKGELLSFLKSQAA